MAGRFRESRVSSVTGSKNSAVRPVLFLRTGFVNEARLGGASAPRRGIGAFAIMLGGALALSFAFDVFRPAALSHPEFAAMVEACAVLAASAGAWACRLNFAATGRLRDLLLCAALVLLAAITVTSLAGPEVLELRSPTVLAGAPMIGGLLAAACCLAAALTPVVFRAGARRRWGAIGVGAGLAAAAAAALASWLLRRELVPLVANSGTHWLSLPKAHPLTLLLVIVSASLSALAAGLFLTDANQSNEDRRDRWVAPLFAASVVLIVIGGTCLEWFTLPSAGATTSIAPGASIWLVAFCLMSVGAIHELGAQRRLTAEVRAELDRRRLARDLHDGICQDLAFIAAGVARLAPADGDDHPIAVAARRALAASRDTLGDLSASGAPNVREALRKVADELALRFGINIDVHSRAVAPEVDREAVVRIVREAIVNAARHGNAQNVHVSLLMEEGRLVLRVQDDGRGLGSAELRREGFGLTSMHQRARELGGQLDVRPRDEGGTELEVVFP